MNIYAGIEALKEPHSMSPNVQHYCPIPFVSEIAATIIWRVDIRAVTCSTHHTESATLTPVQKY